MHVLDAIGYIDTYLSADVMFRWNICTIIEMRRDSHNERIDRIEEPLQWHLIDVYNHSLKATMKSYLWYIRK